MEETEKKEVEVFNIKGFDIKKVIEDARQNNKADFAELAEKHLAEYERAKANLQTIYDLIAQKWSSTGEAPYNIDVEYAKTILK